jgi:hypothetical protein
MERTEEMVIEHVMETVAIQMCDAVVVEYCAFQDLSKME